MYFHVCCARNGIMSGVDCMRGCVIILGELFEALYSFWQQLPSLLHNIYALGEVLCYVLTLGVLVMQRILVN
jgi:hypothetical protein